MIYDAEFDCRLSLNVLTLTIESTGVYTQLGVAVAVTGIAQVLDSRGCRTDWQTKPQLYPSSTSKYSMIT